MYRTPLIAIFQLYNIESTSLDQPEVLFIGLYSVSGRSAVIVDIRTSQSALLSIRDVLPETLDELITNTAAPRSGEWASVRAIKMVDH